MQFTNSVRPASVIAEGQGEGGAGKFLIVAPNTPDTLEALARIQSELDAWFLQHTFGQSGIGLAWLRPGPRFPDELPTSK